MTFNELIYFSIFVGGGIATGLLVYRLVLPMIRRAVARTQWLADDLIIESIGKWVIPWFIALGCYLGWQKVDMSPKYHLWLERALFIFYTFSITWIAARVLSGMTQIKSAKSREAAVSSSIVSNIIKVLVYCMGALVVLQFFGVSITPILAGLGVGGLAVALALQDTLSNLFAGIQLIATKKINPGDLVRLESGQEGFIEDISWRYTTIRTGDNNNIIIPNSKLSGLIVSNFFTPDKEVVFSIPVGVDYNSDLDKVERIVTEVMKTLQEDIEECVPNFNPFVRYQQFGASSIDLKAFIRVREFGAQSIVKHEFIKRIQKRFREENINIPFPVQTVLLQKPEE
ncbi:MAG: mechanosensitive ion channel family protein [Chitinophagaceae bacterium]|nr:mechanosensitive ion channel family protein [Chitinophagaceae bacterium]